MNISRHFVLIFVNLIIIITIGFIWLELENSFIKKSELSKDMLIQEASSNFDNMVVTRSWNSLHGGLYAKAKEGEKPNPYLEENHIYSDKGDLLIKINPAWMTRQIAELSNKQKSNYYKITSLKPINPENKPDMFETEALRFFEMNPSKKYYYNIDKNLSKFNFMGALKIEKSCLQCHAVQGYKIGDIRGGIRVSIPTINYQTKLIEIKNQTQFLKLMVVIFGIFILILFNIGISLIYKHQEQIEYLNKTLEAKVIERTKKLSDMYKHEKYLKEILKTIADVNELLISSFSLQTVMKNSTDRLIEHKHYRFIWIGLVSKELLEVAYASTNNYSILDKHVYSINTTNVNPLINNALNSLKSNRTIIEKLNIEIQDIGKAWMLSIPLQNADEKEALGVINVYSDRKEGFESEEIRMLENLATDIGLALHSIQQRTILEQMESDKIANFEETILAFVNIIEQRDSYTAGHTLRVAKYCRQIAQTMGIQESEIIRLEKAAILHDIGKVATPDAILLKPGHLDMLEYELIKQHAEAGYSMLSKIEMYKELSEIIRFHHARYDGKGYPQTSNPDDIPFLAYIMALADAFDAMTSNRIYKSRKSIDEALAEIKQLSGIQFHPDVALAAQSALKDITLEDTHQLPDNELEQKRFSYFFQDALTGVYNESYLKMVLLNENRVNNVLHLITLKNFSSYNKIHGWHKGDYFLQTFAKKLQLLYPDTCIFRFHGDDFVILSKKGVSVEIDLLNDFEFIKTSDVWAGYSVLNLKNKIYNIDEIELLAI